MDIKPIAMYEDGDSELVKYNLFTALEQLEKYENIVDDIDKYIHSFKIKDIGEMTMLILNDILLIKNGLGKDVVRLNKIKGAD